MKLTRIINKFINYIYFLITYRSHGVAYSFANNKIPLNITETVHRKGSVLHFDRNPQNDIPLKLISSFNHPQLNYVVKLLNHSSIFLAKAEKGKLILRFNGVNYSIGSPTNLTIIDEMLFDNCYSITAAKPCVLLDIGMNVGYASLYFSSLDSVKKVYSYEPFEETYLIAKQNIADNETYGKKILAFNYGISNYTGTIDVPLLEGGSVVASTEKSFIKNYNIHSAKSITVNVRNILDVLTEIKNENPGMNIGLKIDCEGEEYNILEAMHQAKHFEQVSFLCIEWHLKGPDRIKEILTLNNFIVYNNPKSLIGEHGLIYGFRTTNS